MSQPFTVATQRPPSTLDTSENETPGHLFGQLKALSEWANDHRPPEVKLSNESDRKNCMDVVRKFYDHVIESFPSPQEYPWSAIHEKIKLIEASFVVFPLVGPAFCAENDFLDFSRRFFIRVLNVCHVLEGWVDVPDLPIEDGYPSPRELHERGEDACIGLLRSWFGSIKTERSGLCGWQVAKEIVTELLGLCQDLLHGEITDDPTYIRLFSSPRLHQGSLNALGTAPTVDMILDNRSSQQLLIASVFRIMLEGTRPPLLSDWFLTETLRNVVDSSLQAFHSIASASSCITSDARRARSMSRLTITVATSLQSHPTYRGTAETMRLHLLLSRLHDGPVDFWEGEEERLLGAFHLPLSVAPCRADLDFILQSLTDEHWGKNGDKLRELVVAFLTSCLSHFDVDFLFEIKTALSQTQQAFRYGDILEAVEKQVASMQTIDAIANDPPSFEQPDWRRGVRVVVQAIVEPNELAWMDDDNPLSDSQYISRALSEVEHHFDRPLDNPTPHARIALAKELARLPCALARHLDSPCPSIPNRISIISIPTGMRAVITLLDGTEKEVTPSVYKAVYDALSRVIKHHTSGFGPAMMEPVFELSVKGMKNRDRGVRLSAGRCLAELVKKYEDKGLQGASYIEFMLKQLDTILSRYTDPFKETALITSGLIAKHASPETLYWALLCLISQLGNSNPVLKGTAFMQLAAIVDHHGKSRYSLLHPYMEQLAIFVVDRMYNHPALLTEYCHFLGASRADFFSATMDAIIPHLFATCNGTALSLVATELSCDVASLFWKRQAKILAHAYMATIPGHRQKCLKFILSFFQTSQGQPVATASELILSSLVELVSELVLHMGDEDERVVESAIYGLMRVEDTLNQGTTQTQPRSAGQTLGSFLEAHILGVITYMIEILEDVKEKRTLKEKKSVARAIGKIVREVGAPVSSIAPQIMAMLQTMLAMPDLRDITLQSWNTFLRVLDLADVGSYIGPTGAAFLTAWPSLSQQSKELVRDCLHYLVIERGDELGPQLDDLADLTSIPELFATGQHLVQLREGWTLEQKLEILLGRVSSENINVASRALEELRAFLSADDESFVRGLTSGDAFHPLVGQIFSALLLASCRDGEGSEAQRTLAFHCIGILGAVDPYRFEVHASNTRMIVIKNFTDADETAAFVIHLIKDVLVDAYRSTSDMQYQRHLAYALQELLKICGFSPSLVTRSSNSGSVQLKARKRWNSLPKSVIETVTPLLKSRYKLHAKDLEPTQRPIYSTCGTYREWVQIWMTYLIPEAAGKEARRIFGVFPLVVRNRDVGVARHLLPHLVLNVLISGSEKAVDDIRAELLAVLQDQVDAASLSSTDKKDLSAQTVFMILDHLNGWLRQARQGLSQKTDNRNRIPVEAHEQLMRIDSVLTNIDQILMAKAAFQCKAYARALMCFEQQIVAARGRQGQDAALQEHYERLHEIYAQLDEPDGMEGASTLILSPSLEFQIRQHENTGRWTSAQSCWEVNLQHDPNDLKSHLGLLRCLRHLGHYDTMRTHVEGMLTRCPAWEPELLGYQVESECMIGDWDKVSSLVEESNNESPPVLLAKILLAMREDNDQQVATELSHARRCLGAPIAAVDAKGYSRCYEAVLDLHVVHELEVIYHEVMTSKLSNDHDMKLRLGRLQDRLAARLESTLPIFRIREPILSIRRTVFELSLKKRDTPPVRESIGQSWLLSAKLARKAGYWHTAYSAVLQAQRSAPVFTVMESARLAKASGEPVRALQELDNFYRVAKAKGIRFLANDDSEDNASVVLEDDITEYERLQAKTFILRARWMNESDRYEGADLLKLYQEANDMSKEWESGQFHWGQFQDKCYKQLSEEFYYPRGLLMNVTTISCYCKSIRWGSKYIYQTVPRVYTLWLDMSARKMPTELIHEILPQEHLNRATTRVWKSFKASPKYKWYTAFPQLLSRVGHTLDENAVKVLNSMISMILQEHPHQSSWHFSSVIHSRDAKRHRQGMEIIKKVQGDGRKLIRASLYMSNCLIDLCDKTREQPKKKAEGKTGEAQEQNQKPVKPEPFRMSKDFPDLLKLAPSPLLIPLQESLIANIPPSSADEATYQPFPIDAPTIQAFMEDIEIMFSLAQPKKIVIKGSNGQHYKFLAKPKDDLRKDARVMDLDAIINKFLKSDSESRRRQLHIRTYGVIPLNETSGLIQWVPNSMPLRFVLQDLYAVRNLYTHDPARLGPLWAEVAAAESKDVVALFRKYFLTKFPPVFHEWFVKTFPEPSAWLASRLAYTRTAAVMSMVGYILGLGDRHCENILLDTNTGDVVHIDLNCLFEKGQRLMIPERVPFRLTPNLVDGFGVTGVEGTFRTACELSMEILRRNKGCLRTILDAFIHDPLTQWAEDTRELRRQVIEEAKREVAEKLSEALVTGKAPPKQRHPNVPVWDDIARYSLRRIERKLDGVFLPYISPEARRNGVSYPDREMPTNSLVDMLIRDASNMLNLAKMYSGWAAFL